MPSVSEKQRRFMGAELARKRAGKKTRTGMSEKQLREFAGKVNIPGGSEHEVIISKEEPGEMYEYTMAECREMCMGDEYKGEERG